MIVYIVFFLLFVLPFIYFPLGGNAYEPIKVLLTELSIQVLFLLMIWKSRIEFKKLDKWQFVAIISLFILSVLHLLTGSIPTKALFGNIFRLQGVVLLWHLLIFAILSASVKLEKIPKWLYISAFVLMSILTVVMAKNSNGRAIATIGEPNALAATFIFWLPFIIDNSAVWQASLFSFLTGICILFTGSRSALIAFTLQITTVVLNKYFRLPLGKVIIVIILLFLFSYGLPIFEKNRVFENRWEIWQTSFISGLKNPLGSGFGNAEKAIADTAKDLHNTIQYQYVDSPHNIFLDWWIQGGVVGLVLFGFLVFRSLYIFIKHDQYRLVIALVGILTVASFNPLSVVSLVALWWLIGQSLHSHGLNKKLKKTIS